MCHRIFQITCVGLRPCPNVTCVDAGEEPRHRLPQPLLAGEPVCIALEDPVCKQSDSSPLAPHHGCLALYTGPFAAACVTVFMYVPQHSAPSLVRQSLVLFLVVSAPLLAQLREARCSKLSCCCCCCVSAVSLVVVVSSAASHKHLIHRPTPNALHLHAMPLTASATTDSPCVAQYDKSGQGSLFFEDMVNVIQDLGLLVSQHEHAPMCA